MSLLWLIQLHEIDYGSCQQNRFIYRKRSCLILDGQFLYKTLKTAGKSVNERPRSFGDLLQVLTRRHCLAYSIVLIILWAYVREPEGRAVVEPGVQWQNQNKHKQHKYGHVQQTTVPDYCKVNSLVVSITTVQSIFYIIHCMHLRLWIYMFHAQHNNLYLCYQSQNMKAQETKSCSLYTQQFNSNITDYRRVLQFQRQSPNIKF